MEEGSYIQVIKAQDGELITGREIIKARIEESMVKSSVDQDVWKIIVLNRYKEIIPLMKTSDVSALPKVRCCMKNMKPYFMIFLKNVVRFTNLLLRSL